MKSLALIASLFLSSSGFAQQLLPVQFDQTKAEIFNVLPANNSQHGPSGCFVTTSTGIKVVKGINVSFIDIVVVPAPNAGQVIEFESDLPILGSNLGGFTLTSKNSSRVTDDGQRQRITDFNSITFDAKTKKVSISKQAGAPGVSCQLK